MYPTIIIGTVAVGQIPRSTERISSLVMVLMELLVRCQIVTPNFLLN